MASNVESGFYWSGFAAGMNGKNWKSVSFAPGTRAFHQFLEGHADGLRGRILQAHGARKSTHHAHGGAYHSH